MQLLIDGLGKNMQEKPFSLTSHHTDKQHRLLKWGLLSLYFISVPLLADPVDQALSIDAREQQRQQERERMLQQQNNPVVDTRIAHSLICHCLIIRKMSSPVLPSHPFILMVSPPLIFNGR